MLLAIILMNAKIIEEYINIKFMKKNVTLLFGGQSAEHEISVISAKNIFNAMDRELFNPILIGVSRTGCFYRFDDESFMKIKKVSGKSYIK